MVASAARRFAAIYVERGLDEDLARRVAEQLMTKDALGAHARDELGISEALSARPVQAALASAASFAAGAALPLAVTALALSATVASATSVASGGSLIAWVSATSLVVLAALGAMAARAGGANAFTGAWRVTFWGALAMAITAGVGALFGAAGAG